MSGSWCNNFDLIVKYPIKTIMYAVDVIFFNNTDKAFENISTCLT